MQIISFQDIESAFSDVENNRFNIKANHSAGIGDTVHGMQH